MIRHTNYTQLIKILKGEDLEFRITRYAVRCSRAMIFENLVIPYDINFRNCEFDELVFRNCQFLGKLSLRDTQLRRIHLESCESRDIELTKCSLKELELCNSVALGRFHCGASSINSLNISGNDVFEAIEVACENNIINASIEDNGWNAHNSFKSTIYICPERFNKILLKNNKAEILHIGTIGQYSHFLIDNFNANLVLFSNCNGNSSSVHFKDIQPIDKTIASVCIVNSDTIINMNNEGVFGEFRNIKKYQQQTDILSSYQRKAG